MKENIFIILLCIFLSTLIFFSIRFAIIFISKFLTMKKILITLSILLTFFFIRFIFSYTILSVPYVFGARTYEGFSKKIFPICIMNPLKMEKVKIDIVHYLENTEIQDYLENTWKKDSLYIAGLIQKVKSPSDSDIISFNSNKIYNGDSLYAAKLIRRRDSLYIAELIRKVFIPIKSPSDFDIISFDIDEPYNEEVFLLQTKKMEEKFVVFRDKETKQIIRFEL